jgi:hypothetical protein
MINNTFFIVVREIDFPAFERREGRDQWGWELADKIEHVDYKEAKRLREEYQLAMPKHVVRIRAVPIPGR